MSDDQTTVTILAPTDLGTVVGTLADLYGELNPDVTVQLVTGESADLLQRVQDGEQASIYIDNASVVRRLDQERYEGEPARFGSDLYRILVAKGNPKGVSDLGVFGTDPNTTSGMCAVEAPCGLAAARILERGGVVGTPDQYQPSDQQLVEQVAAGELDAAIVRRSTARIRFGKSSAVRIDPQHNQRIQYDIVALRDAPPVAGFVEFVETHEGARKILKNRGYLSFYDRN